MTVGTTYYIQTNPLVMFFYYFFVCFSRLQRHRQVYVFTYEIRRIIGRFMYLVLTINYIDHEFSLTVV